MELADLFTMQSRNYAFIRDAVVYAEWCVVVLASACTDVCMSWGSRMLGCISIPDWFDDAAPAGIPILYWLVWVGRSVGRCCVVLLHAVLCCAVLCVVPCCLAL